ncbi:MAG TPA: DNRLRE domain-containing protein [Actinobacteria bacterium]|nr:DNRLRE domain-containing protein [Actinomycetota bacterium]
MFYSVDSFLDNNGFIGSSSSGPDSSNISDVEDTSSSNEFAKELKPKKGEVEVIEKRTQNSKTFKKKNGKHRTVIAAVPVHSKNSKGEWQDVNLNLIESKDDSIGEEDCYKGKKTPYEVAIFKNLNKPTIFEIDGEEIRFKFLQSKAAKVEVAGNKVIYQNAFQDTNIERETTYAGIKDTIILKSSKSPTEFTEEIKTDLEVKHENVDGTGYLLYLKDGEPIAATPCPYLIDAEDKFRYCEQDFTQKGNKYYLTIKANTDGLTFPIKIDPSITKYVNSTYDDTYVQTGVIKNYRSVKCWPHTNMYIGYEDGSWAIAGGKRYPKGNTRGYVQFRSLTNTIPSSAQVDSAYLKMYRYTGSSKQKQINLYEVTSAWNGATTDWYHQPGKGALRGSTTVKPTDGWYSWEIKSLVDDWVKRKKTNNGMTLWMNPESALCQIFYQSTGSCPLYLSVAWTEIPEPTGDMTLSLSINKSTGTVTASGKAKPNVDVKVYADNSAVGTSRSNSSGKYSVNFSLPLGAVRNIRAEAKDANGYLVQFSSTVKVLHYQVAEGESWQDIAQYYYSSSSASAVNKIKNFNNTSQGTPSASWHILIPDPLVSGLRSSYEKTRKDILAVVGNEPKRTYCAEPVDPITGNFVYQAEDISISGKGFSLEIVRTYNSRDSYFGPMGFGWNFSYNQQLSFYPDGTVALINADGRRDYYTLKNGVYCAPYGIFDDLTKNGNGTYTLTKKDKIKYYFNSTGKLTKSEDKNANKTTFSYSSSGLLTKVVDPSARALKFTYKGGTRLIEKIIDSTGRAWSLSYDNKNNLIKVTDPRGGETKYSYGGNHRMISFWTPGGDKFVTNTYDSEGRIIEQKDAKGKLFSFTYDVKNKKTVFKDRRGFKTTYFYDSKHNLVKMTDHKGKSETYAYDSNGNKIKMVDKEGHISRFAYDSLGNLTKIIDPLGKEIGFTYDSHDNLIKEIDALGRETKMAYDSKGNLTLLTDAMGNKTQFVYNSSGALTQMTDANGNKTQFVYDNYNNLIKITDPYQNSHSFAHDAGGRMLSSTDSKGKLTTFNYDKADNLTSRKDSLGNITSFAYDLNDNLTRITDANGKKTSYSYDELDRLIKVTDVLNHKTTYAYDAEDNLTQMTDAKGNKTSYEHDSLSNLNKFKDPKGSIWNYAYDAVGNMVKRVDANGKITTYVYDKNDQLIKIDYPDGGKASYAYDAVGNRVKMTDWQGTTIYTYDKLNRLTKVTYPDGKKAVYDYDKLGNPKRCQCLLLELV